MSDTKPDEKMDLRGVICPLNFVEAKLKLEEMEDGQILELVLDDGDPIRNVPRSLKEEGHRIIKVQALEDSAYLLLIRKGG
ncbi:MAG: sulfurtransferase TusA family protein [Dehalococcoidia bacterium]|nr:sulfurtransferase TusA family protein [Dehalococcoidia bacterium]